jgi:FlaA1/EpsC-like NDP-sugar epimerase
MGEPVRILDLAEEMITLTGLRPYVDMDIVFTGLRPDEKLFEELELSGEQIAKSRHRKIFIGKLNAYPPEEVERALRVLEGLARDGDGSAVKVPQLLASRGKPRRQARPQGADDPEQGSRADRDRNS